MEVRNVGGSVERNGIEKRYVDEPKEKRKSVLYEIGMVPIPFRSFIRNVIRGIGILSRESFNGNTIRFGNNLHLIEVNDQEALNQDDEQTSLDEIHHRTNLFAAGTTVVRSTSGDSCLLCSRDAQAPRVRSITTGTMKIRSLIHEQDFASIDIINTSADREFIFFVK